MTPHHGSSDSLSPPTRSVGQNHVLGPTLSDGGGHTEAWRQESGGTLPECVHHTENRGNLAGPSFPWL